MIHLGLLSSKRILIFVFVGLFVSCGIKKSINDRPDCSMYLLESTKRVVQNDSLFFKGSNSLRKNQYGQWELVASGNPLALGDNIGVLTAELMKKQERIFFSKINEIIPSASKQNLIRSFLKIYNRKIYKHVKEEYKIEIVGSSKYNSDNYNDIAPKYLRSLYLHGAHDIGHALQDLALVGCTSFAVWGGKTPDGELLIGRNFDFYVGDEFAEEKIISFIAPDSGYKFMNVSWAGMIGVMSGMNEKGITVTMNAGKSTIPLKAKTPVSLVTREILQYASNIDEAIKIAKSREVFVSESIMVGSGSENTAVLIEMSPKKIGVYKVENSSQLLCSNHFQSETYKKDKRNTNHIVESHSKYRYDKLTGLLAYEDVVTPRKAVAILRNKTGLNDIPLGYGNEKALNQMLGHHSVVFLPKSRIVWVSANPYQLGDFVAYQLDSVFAHATSSRTTLSELDLHIDKDPFMLTSSYRDYETYRIEFLNLQQQINKEDRVGQLDFDRVIKLNPEFWEAYNLAGRYFYDKKQYKIAERYYSKALTKEITTLPEREFIEKQLKKIKRKL